MRILCYGGSNTWGFKPNSFDPATGLAERYNADERWVGILKKELPDFEIIEEGLNGRTTAFDDEVAQKPMRNGLTYLPFFLEAHYPIDLVVFMLGTNDVKTQYNKTIEEIVNGMQKLIECVLKSNKGKHGDHPDVLIIAPQPIIKDGLSRIYFNDLSIEKSIMFIEALRQLCFINNYNFLDSSKIVRSSSHDGIHLDASEHRKLADAVKSKIIDILKIQPNECHKVVANDRL